MKTLIVAKGEAFDVANIAITDASGAVVDLTDATATWHVEEVTVQSPRRPGNSRSRREPTIPQ